MSDDPTAGAWWEDPETDWTAGKPGKVADVLAAAFHDFVTIRELAGRARLGGSTPSTEESARDAWIHLLERAGASGRVFHLMAEVLQDDGSQQFQVPLAALLGDRRRVVDAIRSIRFGLVEPPAGGTAPSAAVGEGSAALGDEPVGALEAITSPPGGLEDPRAVVQTLLDAMWRTAMIEIEGKARGTGFLVGRDLLLTAAHVIDPPRWQPEPRPDVMARFDYILDPGSSLAETGLRVPVTDLLTASLPTPAEAGDATGEGNAPAEHLDFALLRLGFEVPPVDDRGVPRPRGDYALDPGEYNFAGSPILIIVQHPLGDTQRVTWIRTAAERKGHDTRITYGGNTLQGSSGSAVIDPRGRLVALHHYSTVRRNQAVPVSLIRRALDKGNFGHLFARSEHGPARAAAPAMGIGDPFRTTAFTGRAFVNRFPLRDRLREMAVNDAAVRMLTIGGEPGSGMSYSYLLLSYIAGKAKVYPELQRVAPDGLVVLKLDLASYVRVDVAERAGRVVRDLLDDLGLSYPGEAWAQISRDASALARVLRNGLRGSDRQWWIFVDGFKERVAIKQGGLNEVIHALALVADEPAIPLRLVLAGPDAGEFAKEQGLLVEQDVAVGLVRQDVRTWFTTRAKEERLVLDVEQLESTLDELFPAGGPLPAPVWLGPRLPDRLKELLERRDGS
jgi:Trypsin-like peptidase domain